MTFTINSQTTEKSTWNSTAFKGKLKFSHSKKELVKSRNSLETVINEKKSDKRMGGLVGDLS